MVELAAASLGDICEVGAVGEFCQGVIIYTVGSSTATKRRAPSFLTKNPQVRTGQERGRDAVSWTELSNTTTELELPRM